MLSNWLKTYLHLHLAKGVCNLFEVFCLRLHDVQIDLESVSKLIQNYHVIILSIKKSWYNYMSHTALILLKIYVLEISLCQFLTRTLYQTKSLLDSTFFARSCVVIYWQYTISICWSAVLQNQCYQEISVTLHNSVTWPIGITATLHNCAHWPIGTSVTLHKSATWPIRITATLHNSAH